MTKPKDEKVRRRLQEELARLNDSIVAIKKEPRAQELEGLGDNTPLSEEIDSVSTTEQNELLADRLGRLLDRAAALDEAIHRFDEGVYGLCVSCGAKIAEKRLKAVPEAARCANCQSKVERGQTTEEPIPSEWKAAEEVYEKREADERGFDHHPERGEDLTGLSEEDETKS